MRLVVLGAGLGAQRVLDAREFQQLAGLGGVEDVGGGDGVPGAVADVLQGDGTDQVAAGVGGDGPGVGQHGEPAGGDVRGEHRLQDGDGDARLVAELADAAGPGVEQRQGPRFGAQRIPLPVVGADRFAQRPVGGRDTELLDPRVFVRRDGLRGELAADPVGLLGEDDGAPRTAGGERGGHTARAAARDEDLGLGGGAGEDGHTVLTPCGLRTASVVRRGRGGPGGGPGPGVLSAGPAGRWARGVPGAEAAGHERLGALLAGELCGEHADRGGAQFGPGDVEAGR
ncbi:hypothetical protein APS67_003532 [Streptomyces sp. AVP053U2]|nr:hypothetical protein APS67_003532 [Streptomyces sp. AVP053U2]